MTSEYTPDGIIHTRLSRATEHSASFSDLRADDDTRLLRLWLNSEVPDNVWLPIDIARGGLSTINRFEAVEHNNTRRNSELLKRVALSAFTLYQHDKLTDDDGNFVAFVLPRNAFLQLGQMSQSHFDALRGSSIAQNHIALHVDDNDRLSIEANDLDNTPQIEVIEASSDVAVEIGSAKRNYILPADIGTGYVTRTDRPTNLEPLSGRYAFVPPRPKDSSPTVHSSHHSRRS